MLKLSKRFFIQSGLSILIIGCLCELFSYIIVEKFWFEEVGYLEVFLKQLFWKLNLLIFISSFSIWFLFKNLNQAEHDKWSGSFQNHKIYPKKKSQFIQLDSSPPCFSLGLLHLILIVMALGGIVGFMLTYFCQIAYNSWIFNFPLQNEIPTLPSLSFLDFNFKFIFQELNQLWKIGIIGLTIILVLYNVKLFFRVTSLIFGFTLGLILSSNWSRVLQYLYSVPFGEADPQFGKDISFYTFSFPFWKLIDFWLSGLFLFGLISVVLTYLMAANSIGHGIFPGFSQKQLRHIFTLSSLLVLVIAFHHWLARYELLYSTKGVVFGASYTDVYFLIPVYTLTAIIATILSLLLLLRGMTSNAKSIFYYTPLFLYIAILPMTWFGQEAIQSLIVEPNELAQEIPYIKRNIASTRRAFNLDKIRIKTFDGTGNLTEKFLDENRLTINNIRLWDPRPLLQTNRQLQQLRPYYKFNDADIDRYSISLEENDNLSKIVKEQVLIAARELDYEEVPKPAKTWVNEHLVYTHGYGFTLSPVNKVDEGGLPFYSVQNINTNNKILNEKTFENSEDNTSIDNPRIYFGESTNTYIMTNTEVQELDFPSGQDNVYNTYDGKGGIKIKNWARKILFANYLRDWQMIFTHNFTPDTRLIFRRNINQRIRKIAPFLLFDNDPYLVTTEVQAKNNKLEKAKLYWMIDAYTTSNRYPYSEPGDFPFNYIRNSVKIVIDAYDGDISFYVIDPDDPLIKTWNRIFPNLFKPFQEIPISIKDHIRYPKDMFNAQSERLLTYHMTDPKVFYNREDQWRIPQEIYGENQQPVEPYYLLMSLTNDTPEFMLFNVYTPTSRNNLVAGLFARSDENNYGEMLLFRLPKQRIVYGPEQVEALISQDPVISQQISLWSRQKSQVIQGNLLVIPFFKEQSLLYVEPLYLEAKKNSLPTLVRVIVVYENQVVMAKTLSEALNSIFKKETNL